ncbi:MAG: hypothetical protein ABFC56_01615, partial [Clostridiaceae bacterium]
VRSLKFVALFHSLTWTPFGILASELLACFLFLALYSFQGALALFPRFSARFSGFAVRLFLAGQLV